MRGVKGKKREEAGEKESWNGTGYFCGGLKTSDWRQVGRNQPGESERRRAVKRAV